jgi:hypothetical protein
MKSHLGFRMHLVKYFKIDASDQGIPIFFIYAFRRMSPRNKNHMRFDWFKNTNGDYVQVAGLIELSGKKQINL